MNEQGMENDTVGHPTAIPAASAVAGPPAGMGSDLKGMMLLVAGAGSLLWGLVSALGAGWGVWGWTSGLKGVQWSFFLAIATILFGVLNGWRVRKSGIARPRLLSWVGMLCAIVYAGWVGTFLIAAFSVPSIHDISTDLADPPAFRVLSLRADNLDAVPGEGDDDMKGLNPQQRWVVIHQKSYGDIRSVRINEPVPNVVAKAARLAKARGWDIAVALPEEGRLEATETSALFRFKDDVVLRVKPTETGDGSIVDMRSVSRVGVSDLGVNAKRVRSFLADLSGTVTAMP
ncbi:MAG: DUF1499 domain-containing protein [Sphingorhabdus sp.]